MVDDITGKQRRLFEDACRKAGLRMTYQRQEIYRELVVSHDHPSAETLHMRLVKKMPMLSLDTVYRALATFTRDGLIQKVETVESQARFDAKKERHHHAICSRCHEIIDFHCPSVEEVRLPEMLASWGKIDSRNLVIYGICGKCSQKDVP
jgi:Fur family transcriptional regulator, peroxide stress response regulator